MPTVALALLDDMPLYEVGIACQVFGAPRPGLTDHWYDLRLCASDPRNVTFEFNFAVNADHGFDT